MSRKKKALATAKQVLEVAGWASELTLVQYQERRIFLRALTDPNFPADTLNILTPTTFGEEIKPPFDKTQLIADGSDWKLIDVLVSDPNRVQLVPILTENDSGAISAEDAARRAAAQPQYNWGQRAAFALRDAGNAGRFSSEVWPVGVYVMCPKTRWRRLRDGFVYVWCVVRNEFAFSCYCSWFSSSVFRRGRFAACK